MTGTQTPGTAAPKPGRRERTHYEGDPTLLRVMLRPQWIAALVLALLVAGVFAWLGRWQLGTAIRTDDQTKPQSEVALPISEVVAPGQPLMETAAAAVITVRGTLVADDYLVVEQRMHDGVEGAWLTAHLAVEGGGHLAIAIGWAPNAAAAEQSLVSLRTDGLLPESSVTLEGRYMPPENAEAPKRGADPLQINRMAPAQLINRWNPFEGLAFAGYLVLHQSVPEAPLGASVLSGEGLQEIVSVPAVPADTVNWLNLFYAVEWVVFAGFAVYFWYRLTRDAWEKAHELKRLEAEA